MNLSYLSGTPRVTCFANDNDALIPELWARQALKVLMSKMVMTNLVNRDFNEMVANFGDVVNTSRPSDFSAKRKTDADSVVEQDAISPNIQVKLDQHLYVTFVIKDGEMSLAMPDLVERYMEPAARELAEKVDAALAGQVARLVGNTAGRLGEMDATNASEFILEATTQLDENRVDRDGRNLVLGPRAQHAALQAKLVVEADKRGDEGTALRNANIGRIYGQDTFMDQNVPYVKATNADSSAGATTAADVAGSTAEVPTTVPTADVTVGSYVVVEGDGEPYRVASVTDNGGSADIAVEGGFQHDIASGAAVTAYKEAASDGAYDAGYAKNLVVDGHAAGKNVQEGQWVTYGTGAAARSYTVIDAVNTSTTSTTVLLDRPLELAVADNDPAYPGPAGGFNLSFVKDAIAFVNRPLHMVPEGTGARSFVASFNDLSIRVTMQYDGKVQGMRVTFDLLAGVSILDERMAVVLLS